MPTQQFGLASTQKDIVLQQFLQRHLGGVGDPNFTAPLRFFGQTTADADVELLIEQKAAVGTQTAANFRRLYIPEDGALMFRAYALAWNMTDGTLDHAASYVGGLVNDGGTTASIVDVDTVTGGTQAFVVEADWVAKTTAGLTLTFTADDTDDYLKIVANGLAAKTHRWEVIVEPVCYVSANAAYVYGDVNSYRT